MSMTTEAKRHLSATIRALRARLLQDLAGAVDGAYRLSVPVAVAGLDERGRARRARFEDWLAEQVRAQAGRKGVKTRTREDFRRDAEKQAAYTLLNRLVILRLLEATGLRKTKLVTGGWESAAYKAFRGCAPALRKDVSEGYDFLLQLTFEELATDMPGLFGPAGIAELVPVPASTLRHAIEELDDPTLTSCWTDDMTLGWVYQYWNDPEREALDAKLNAGGKIEPHEIASKTQMFTERYMVDWLLQNSLGPMWLAMCRKQGWTPEVVADGTLDRLEARRVDWRAKRDAGEVSLTELMPLHSPAEQRWAYYVPQEIPEDAVETAPASVRELKLIDPAVGSGHFLVVAFELLVALYREEARQRGEAGQEDWTDAAIVERILEFNLHGIDLDPRAVQIAAAALWLKAVQTCPTARPRQLNLVASNLNLAALPDDDPALVELRRAVEQETGIPGALTDTVVQALKGADHLGSLLRVDQAVEAALERHAAASARVVQGTLWPAAIGEPMDRDETRSTMLAQVERFLGQHSGGDDLGLRLRGAQLSAGIRFMRMLREEQYHLVVGNPPYQGTAKLAEAIYVQNHYHRGKSDLYAAFLERALQLVRGGGTSALLTMRNWMFIKQYAELRTWLLGTYDLRALGDFDRGGFEEITDEIVSVVVTVFRRSTTVEALSVALQPTRLHDGSRDNERTLRKRAAVKCHVGRTDFVASMVNDIPEFPIVYWWSKNEYETYVKSPKFGDVFEIRQGLCTGDNIRALRFWWEADRSKVVRDAMYSDLCEPDAWLPFIKGGESRVWVEPLLFIVNWRLRGLEIKVGHEFGILAARPQNEKYYLQKGVAVQTTGSNFSARIHRYNSIFGDKARSVFPKPVDIGSVVCLLNEENTKKIAESFNPTIDFTVGDLKRIPFRVLNNANEIESRVVSEFDIAESHREPSIEFIFPGPSQWEHAQICAQAAVDQNNASQLISQELAVVPERPSDHLSYALGVSLGRFGATGEGILDPSTADLSATLPAGTLFLDGTLDPVDRRDGLGLPGAAPLHAAWATHGPAIAPTEDLRTWLRLRFFDLHRPMYENRPIHWPLSSEKKTFVAWITIHRWEANTLKTLLADHLHPAFKRLEGELADLRAARDGADKKASSDAEKRTAKAIKARDELAGFITLVTQCAEQGPLPPDAKCPPRDVDARYVPDLDDGVMINSAALWPLLKPQWKDPEKWWKELASSQGKKDYDWAHLAMRYWPYRVDQKCQQDPSLGVAHGCFWNYHPARAWSWELRLQDEIGPDFRIAEAPYRGDGGDGPHRAAYLAAEPRAALAAVEKEALRRRGRGKATKPVDALRLLETGLWRSYPQLCWELELRIAKKQGADFHLLAPDEAEARMALVAAHPELVAMRGLLVASLVPPAPEPEEADETTTDDDRDEEAV